MRNGIESILVFRHPEAGIQLVKGTLEAGERADEAALRELFEESGISDAEIVKELGVWDTGYSGQVWRLFLCDCGEQPERWTHHTKDDGGKDFAFFWHPLNEQPDRQWHQVYREALKWILNSR